MKNPILAGIACVLAALTVHAQESIYADDVVVTANRVPQSRENVLADVSVIEREEIERAGQSTLVELLQRQPGVEITSNGGPGKVSGVFLRGTNTGHVVVLVDGMRINSATVGTTAFENLPLGQIERIEILRGPASSLYGADAIGGVIQLFTKRGEGVPTFSAFAGYGRYDTKRGEAAASGSIGDTRYSLNVSSLDTDGFSAYRTHAGYDADNDGYRNQAVSASLEHALVPGHTLGLQFFQSEGHTDYDAGENYPNHSKQTLQTYALTSTNQLTDYWHSFLRAGAGIDDYSDQSKPYPFYSPTGKSDARTKQTQYTWQNDLTLPLGTLTLAYDRLNQKVSGSTDYTVTSRNNNGWLASYLTDIGRHSLRASLRLDDNSQYGDRTTGGLSYGYRLTPEWRASASYGTAFKAPAFNLLYYPGFSNPNLKPETSRNREAAIRYEAATLSAEVVAFYNEIDDLIESPPPTYFPQNVANAKIGGITIDGNWFINGQWTLSGSFTRQSPKNEDTDKLLIQRGQRHGTLNLAWQPGAVRLGAEMVGDSHRYSNAANTFRMGGYTLFNLTAGYAINSSWRLEARADNIFDKDYVLASTKSTYDPNGPNYDTPGANLFVGLRFQLK